MPGGFKFIGSQQDSPDGKLRRFDVASSHATRLSIGDAVVITGDSTSTTGVALVDAAVAAGPITGIISGVVPNFATENLTDTGLAASTAGSVLVRENPRDEFLVDVANGPLVAADVGLNVPLVATAASLSGGLTISNMTVNATGKATTSTLPFRVVALAVGTDGVLGSAAKVRLNASTSIAGATGV